MGLSELLEQGRRLLEGRKIDFMLKGVETGWVQANNRRVMQGWALRQRAIDAPARVSTEARFLGFSLQTPVIMSAMTMPIPAICDNGLLMVAQGLRQAGSLMWTGSPVPQDLEGLLASGVPLVVSLKPYADRDKLLSELARVAAAGVSHVSLEVDAGMGTKIQDQQMVSDCSPLSLEELRRLRQEVAGRLILKGVLSRADAELALEAMADALVLSNHGAHTIDYLPHPLQVMDEIEPAVMGRVPLVMDGGFRRGSDALKGLALGADFIGLGRPILYGLAADGASGVRQVVELITAELARSMSMVGAAKLSDLSPQAVIRLT